MPEPKISLITVVRNGAAFMERCLQSVEAQTYDNIEYIVLDGASTDGTQGIIERHRPSITHYASKPDKGPYEAQMEGISLATGEIIGLLMADDWLAPDAMEVLADMYRKQPDASLFCFGMQEYQEDEYKQLHKTRMFCDPSGERFQLLDGLYCHGLNRFYARQVLKEQVFARNDRYPQLADRDLYVRLGMLNLKKAHTPQLLYHMVVHPGSNSMGGSHRKISQFLEETALIASDHLRERNLTVKERMLLVDWYCFNNIRATWFLLKSRQVRRAIACAARTLVRYPVATVTNIVQWRLPEAYRPVKTS